MDTSDATKMNAVQFRNFGRKQIFTESLASGRAKALRDQMGKPKDQDKTSRQNGQAHDHDIVKANGYAGEKPDNRPFSISCEWDINQTQQFSDDGTNTYFW